MSKQHIVALNVETSEVKAHATYSASGSERWLKCPGSINLSAKAPEPPESKYALEGTKAHACLELLLKNRGEDEALELARKTFPSEMVGYALDAVAYIEERLAERPGAELLVETEVDSSYFTMSGQFGTLDVAIVEDFGRLIIMDYKYGAGHAVDPEGPDGRGNSQLVYYALGLSYLFNHNFAEVELVVIQPRAFHESGNTTRSHVMSMGELLAWRQVFRDGVMASGPNDAPLAAGSWCKWCPAGVICPKLKGDALRDAQVAFSDEGGLEAAPEPRMIRLPDLGTILDGCDKLEAWIEKVRQHAYGVLERGGSIPGYKLVAKRPYRKWTDGAADEAFKRFGASVLAPPKLIAPGQFKERLGKKDAAVVAFLERHTVSESSGATLVRDGDKRSPVVGRAASVFDVVETTVTVEKAVTLTKRTRRNG